MNAEYRKHEAAKIETEMPKVLAEAGEKLATVDNKVLEFVRERPLFATLTALTTGYLLGRLLQRR